MAPSALDDSPFRVLSADLLHALVDAVDVLSDGLAFACTCTPLRAAIRARFPAGTLTRRSSMWNTPARLEWARTHCHCPWSAACVARAAMAGNIDAIKWARANGCPCDSNACAYAARGGQLTTLQWLHSDGCPWDGRTCAFAADAGHLEVLRFARAHGCPCNARVCACAARRGHLAVLEYLRFSGIGWDAETCAFAAEGGHLAVLQWARAKYVAATRTLVALSLVR